MEEKRNRPAFRGRDAAMLGGIVGGIEGSSFPLENPQLANKIFDETVLSSLEGVPLNKEFGNALAMQLGGNATLAGAGVGALGGLAAYHLLKAAGKGAIEGGKAIKKAIDKSKEKSNGN